MRDVSLPGLLVGALCLAALPAATRAETPFYYYADGDQTVITNLPGKAQAKAVPGLAMPVTRYDPVIERVAEEFDLSPLLIKAVARVESGFNPRAVSPKGAQGLMQLMPRTARHYGVRNAFDPQENLRAGARHLRHLLDEFSGDLTLALAAYNAGSTAVRRHGGVPAYAETRNYVRKVQASMGGDERTWRRAPATQPVRMVRASDGSIRLTN